MANVFANTYAEPSYGVDDEPRTMVKHMQTTASVATGSVIYMGHIPAGAYIMGIDRKSADLGTGTVNIGYTNDETTAATAFASALDVGAGALAMAPLDFAPLKVNRKTDIIVTTSSTGNLSGQFDLVVTYRTDGVGTRLYT